MPPFFEVTAAARSSALSRAQVAEIFHLLNLAGVHCAFKPLWIESRGDLDKNTSLRTQENNDFFSKEIDQAVLEGRADISVHSAKDLPDQVPLGLERIALTPCLCPHDALVVKRGKSLSDLPFKARVGSSSVRRDKLLTSLRPDVEIVDIRGTIEERLALLDTGFLDAVVIAECALLRLQLNPPRIILEGDVHPMQGRLAVFARLDSHLKPFFLSLNQSGP